MINVLTVTDYVFQCRCLLFVVRFAVSRNVSSAARGCSTLRACSITVQAAIFSPCVARISFLNWTFPAMDPTQKAKNLVRKWNGNYEYL